MLRFLLLGIILVFHIALGLIIFLKNPRNRINQYFGLMDLFGAIWIFSNYLENEQCLRHYSEFLLKLDFASAIFLGLFFYFFASIFLLIKKFLLKDALFSFV